MVVIRTIRREKFYSFINLTGLAIGITSCLLIGLYVADELRFDRFHEKADRIARLTMEYRAGDDVQQVAVTGTRPGPFFSRTFPEIEGSVRMIRGTAILRYGEKIFEEKNALYADSAFLEIFSFPLMAGDPETALDEPGQIVITRTLAEKYFGKGEALGKVFRVNDEKEYTVSGIVENVPANSQLLFDIIIPFGNLQAAESEDWFPANYFTYLLLDQRSPIRETENKIDTYMQGLSPEEIGLPGTGMLTYHLEPLTRIHLYSELEGLIPNGNISYVYMMAAIAVLILLIACINYTNLSVARAARRNKEIGMRKVLGARRSDLFRYFIMESTVLALLATLAALFASVWLLPLFNTITGKSIAAGTLFTLPVLTGLLALTALVGLFSGIYPALRLSRYELIRIFRTGSEIRMTAGGLGRSLIVFQFVVSIFLIIATVIIHQQRTFLHKKDLGYNKENVVILPADRQVKPHYQEMKDAMRLQPGVVNISAGYDLPTFIRWTNSINATTASGEKIFSTKAIPVDLDFLATLDIELLAGSDFSPSDLEFVKTSRQKEEYKSFFIINESALSELGWSPEEAIGRTITCGMEGTIKGVVKDFHISSLHNRIPPLVIFLYDQYLNLMFVRIEGERVGETLAGLESVWKERISERPFEYHFLDEDYERLYIQEQKSAKFISTFASLAIVLACMGLFGLSAFMAVSRTKEIGIRKVLGASVSDINLMLSKEFMIMVGLACLIAFPLGWYTAREWLERFAFHIEIPWWAFAGTGMLALLISFITVSLQSLRVAMTNPVDSLRNE